MTEAEWLAATDARPMLAIVKGRKHERKLRLFAVACCRRVGPPYPDVEAEKALAVAELFADGLAPKAQRGSAYRSALSGSRFSHYYFSPVAAALSKAAFEAASRASEAAANRVARTGVEHLPEPATTAEIHEHAAMRRAERAKERNAQTALLRCLFGNPFRPVATDPAWRTSTVVSLAGGTYANRAFDRMPILADALMDAGCVEEVILGHCRGPGPHVRGCWVVDAVLGKS
jgi:hypothetical protein